MKSGEPLILTVNISSIGIGYVLSQPQTSDHIGKLIETNLIWIDSSKRVTNENGFNGFIINRSLFCNNKVRLLVTWCEILVNYSS